MHRAFITGGHGDIGRALVTRFQQAGYEVEAPRSSDLDLSAADQNWNTYFSQGRIEVDTLIHCAGFNRPQAFDELSKDNLDHTLAVNTLAFTRLVRRFAPAMKDRRRGRILAISSLYGSFAREGRLAYVIAKHALNGAVKTLAIELGRYGIVVNTLSPGFVDTRMTRMNNRPEMIKSLERKIPVGRLGKPEEIAEVAFFLCSPQNTYLNGQDIVVDGGYSVGGFQTL